jgi:hypothetical protein
MSESQVFRAGDRVTFIDGGRGRRIGTVTDAYCGPVSGVWLYVVDGTGYTENELRLVTELRKVAS